MRLVVIARSGQHAIGNTAQQPRCPRRDVRARDRPVSDGTADAAAAITRVKAAITRTPCACARKHPSDLSAMTAVTHHRGKQPSHSSKATMKIAQVAPLYESVPPLAYGATERVVSYLTEELVRRGVQGMFAREDCDHRAPYYHCKLQIANCRLYCNLQSAIYNRNTVPFLSPGRYEFEKPHIGRV